MGKEYELKFSATEEQFNILRRRYSRAAEIRMETMYFDTPDRALQRRRWTLRLRSENGISYCTLKTPDTDGTGVGEWTVRCGAIIMAPEKLVKRGAPSELVSLTRPGIETTCGAQFTRYAVLIPVGKSVIELAMDTGCLLGGDKKLPFREVEMELKEGSTDDCDRIAWDIADELGLKVESKSKFRRAAALAEGE